MGDRTTAINIGISGWRYSPWRGIFYPPRLPQQRELEFASRMFPSIEINGSFYNLQRPQSYQSWYETTPADFIFSVKAPRYITHILRLREIDTPLANFLASGLFNLREKLGPILWQFPPSFRFDAGLFENFLRLLPMDTAAAAKMARRHDAHVSGRALLRIDGDRPLRHAVEIRNKSFIDDRFVELLRRYGVALVVADTAGKWPYSEDVTADFVYLRLHGDAELYASGYTDAALQRWAQRIERWHAGAQPDDAQLIDGDADVPAKRRAIFCYFDNDIKVKAPFDAAALLAKLGLDSPLLRDPSSSEQWSSGELLSGKGTAGNGSGNKKSVNKRPVGKKPMQGRSRTSPSGSRGIHRRTTDDARSIAISAGDGNQRTEI